MIGRAILSFFRAATVAALLSVPTLASQGSLVIPNTGTLSGLSLVTAINAGFDAIATCNSGATQPLNSAAAPSTGPMSMQTFVSTYLNPGLQALLSCSSGASSPANSVGSAPSAQQCWVDTSGNPTWIYRIYDGSQWIAVFSLNASSL